VTPGRTNDATAAPLTVLINEWMALNNGSLTTTANGNQRDDWFELHNPAGSPADLSGYFLTDNLNNPNQFKIPAGYVIPPHGYLLVWADSRPSLNTNTDPALHVNFRLAQDGEAIGLFASDGTPIDAVTFGPQYADVSAGRQPDGAAAQGIAAFTSPTPGAANGTFANRYPTLAPVPDATAYVGLPFTFNASAADPDAPPQILTFSLNSGLATNATINTSSGAFSWTPTMTQTNLTNRFTLTVGDNGAPALSASRSFTLIVRNALLLTGVMRTAEGIVFQVGATPGKTYRVEFTPELVPSNWMPLGPDVMATSTTLSVTNMIGPDPQRFYRVQQLD
jgi:hypothetical protein